MKEGIFPSEQSGEKATIQQRYAGSQLAGSAVSTEDLRLVEALRSGNESAFVSLIDMYNTSMLRLAMIFVSSQAVAEEVVQETWMGVLQGLDRFEGRSSLKTWIFRILTNRAKTRAQREGRSVPFSSLPEFTNQIYEPAVEPERFREPDQQWPGHWISFPHSWDEIPEERILSLETMTHIQEAIDNLPPGQREVITLRDVEGWSSDEACNLLGVSESNQRVLLHRARSRVRRALEKYFEEE
jgi:RNA polymerase sigma-70 factor (ECF subfamily)